MPGTGGRFGWNEPPPAAITTTLQRNVVARVGGQPEAAVGLARCRLSTIWPRWKVGLNGLICSRSFSTSPSPVIIGIAGNVVDRLLRIELGALAARLVEDVDDRRLDVEEAEFEDREKADRPGADDDDVGLDHSAAHGDVIHRDIPRLLAGGDTYPPNLPSKASLFRPPDRRAN